MGKRVTDRHKTSPGEEANDAVNEHAPAPPSVTPRQERAIGVLLSGSTDAEAAAEAGVSRETCCRWRHRNADFIAAMNEARQDLAQDFHDGLRALLPGEAVVTDSHGNRDTMSFRTDPCMDGCEGSCPK
jgi:hypothetical protein